jgi:hypothetical protein
MPQTKKKCCISSRHKVNTSYHILPNDITLNATGLRDHIMSAAEYASSKILPRFQNLRTNVNISVTLQDSSLEKLEKLSSFSYLPSILRTLVDCTFFDRRQTQKPVWRELICREFSIFHCFMFWN